jgi:hypothetical protein
MRETRSSQGVAAILKSSDHRYCTLHEFLGAFAKSRKATISFFIFVCPAVCPSVWNNSAPTGRVFLKSDTRIFRKSVEKIQVSLKSDNNNGYFR